MEILADLELVPVANDMGTAIFVGEHATLLCSPCVWQLVCNECCYGAFPVHLNIISFTSTVCALHHFTQSTIEG